MWEKRKRLSYWQEIFICVLTFHNGFWTGTFKVHVARLSVIEAM